MHRPALYTAAAVFALVAALHVARYLADTEIIIGGAAVPVFVSLPAGLAAAALAVWMIIAARRL